MPKFNSGDRIMIPVRNNQTGTVRSFTETAGLCFYQIVLDTGASISEIESNIVAEIKIETPFDLLRTANFQDKVVFTAISTMNKLKSGNRNSIASFKSSKTKFHPYQFKPLLKFLNSPNRRILIADEVGLGKTIEAGYVLTEMSLRGLIRNCLVICKSSLKIKWQTEMKEKFGFDFKIYKRKELMDDINEDSAKGIKSVFGIINYDYNEKHSDAFLKQLEELDYNFDLLVVDEAHILRNESTIKHKAIREIINNTDYVLLMTATPVMTSLDNLYNLLKLIEPHYDEYSLFRDHLELSRPFIQALRQLNEGLEPQIVIQELKNSKILLQLTYRDGTFALNSTVTVEERFRDDELFKEVVQLSERDSLSHKHFVKLQHNLSELNSFHPIITRTRKREIQDELEQVIRDVKLRFIDFTDEEMAVYESIINMYDEEPLALVTKKREATSCLPAFLMKNKDMLDSNLSVDSKFNELKRIVDEVVITQKKKLIIFSFFKGTLSYIGRRISQYNIVCARIDGDIPIEERQGQLNRFRDDPSVSILLSSEVGSEGLDMQFCDALVNYDLPWNPMVVEQRIGRIDRVGQKSKIIYAYNLCIKGTIEEQIVNRLFSRIGMFKQSLGLLEDILSSDETLFENDTSYQILEAKLYGSKLSSAAREKLLLDAERAIENALLTKQKIEKELDASFVSDLYIKDQLKEINNEKKYVTNHGIQEMLSLLFKTRLATIRADLYSSDPYIRVGPGDTSLFDFIDSNIPPKSEQPHLYNAFLSFKKKNRKCEVIQCTFDQEVAFDNKDLEFLSATHPLVQATFYYFKQRRVDVNKAFSFLYQSHNSNLEKGIYALLMYDCEVHQSSLSGKSKSYFELPLIFRLEGDEFVELRDSELESFLEIDFADFINHPSPPSGELCEIFSLMLTNVSSLSIYNRKNEIENEERKMHYSRQFRLIETEVDYLKRRIEQDQFNLRQSHSKIANIIISRIKEYENRIAQLDERKREIQYNISENIQSISIVEIR